MKARRWLDKDQLSAKINEKISDKEVTTQLQFPTA